MPMTPPVRGPLRRYVLVADADTERAFSYRQMIAGSGYDVVMTRDGHDALQILEKRGAPLLLLTDLSLPHVDGFAVIARLRALASAEEAPVIAFSAFDEIRTYTHARRNALGIAEVLPHGPPAQLLRGTVETLLAAAETGESAAPGNPGNPGDPGDLGGLGDARDRDPLSVDRVLKSATAECLSAFAAKGAVVYVKSGNREWVQCDLAGSDAAAQSLHGEGSLFEELLRAGDMFILPAQAPASLIEEAGIKVNLTKGFVGIPLAGERVGLVGVLALFDTESLQLGPYDIDALQALGRRLSATLEQHIPALGTPVQRQGESVLVDEEFFRQLSHLALSDSLTGLANRRGGELAIQREIARARREGTPLSFVLIDVDDFKRWNDDYGHDAGDDVLCQVAGIVGRAVRGSDLAVRWGGEEFLLVLPKVAAEGARVVAERVRAEAELSSVHLRPLTVSAGVAELEPGENVGAVLARADAKLSRAKSHGRNRVVV
jgi:diguanylate cyclase (GGDEF)-like protein